MWRYLANRWVGQSPLESIVNSYLTLAESTYVEISENNFANVNKQMASISGSDLDVSFPPGRHLRGISTLLSPNQGNDIFKDLEEKLKKTKGQLETLHRDNNNSAGMEDYFTQEATRLSQEWNNLAILRQIQIVHAKVDSLLEAITTK